MQFRVGVVEDKNQMGAFVFEKVIFTLLSLTLQVGTADVCALGCYAALFTRSAEKTV